MTTTLEAPKTQTTQRPQPCAANTVDARGILATAPKRKAEPTVIAQFELQRRNEPNPDERFVRGID